MAQGQNRTFLNASSLMLNIADEKYDINTDALKKKK